MTEEALRSVVREALLRVANNVAKHIIQRDGWTADDQCFQIDLRHAEDEIVEFCQRTINN